VNCTAQMRKWTLQRCWKWKLNRVKFQRSWLGKLVASRKVWRLGILLFLFSLGLNLIHVFFQNSTIWSLKERPWKSSKDTIVHSVKSCLLISMPGRLMSLMNERFAFIITRYFWIQTLLTFR
jgi:hypothetical protein